MSAHAQSATAEPMTNTKLHGTLWAALTVIVWSAWLWFALLQGAPLAMLTAQGLALAPAGHLTLSTGLMPLFTSLLCFYFLGEAISRLRKYGLALITLGALAIGGVSIASIHLDYWKGDILFVCAGMLGSVYLLRMRRSGLSALQGAALLYCFRASIRVC